MKVARNRVLTVLTPVLAGITVGVLWTAFGSAAAPLDHADKTAKDHQEAEQTSHQSLPTLEEARERARLLHETVHSTLQVVHHQYYRENQGLPLPARTLKVVFGDLARRRNVNLQWLVVDADAGNVDHNPKTAFEKDAVQALAAGKKEFELAENGIYRHAGAIALSGECLSCHLPNRTSSKDRTAGLVIAMPVKKDR